MNHCVVPSNWDLEHNNSAPPKFPVCAVPSKSSNSLPSHVPSLDYEVAELTWENGQIAMHGLGPPRVVNKSAAGAGTLESIVSQATCHPQQKPTASSAGGGCENSYEMGSCFEKCRAMVNPTAACSPCIPGTMDALVPCQGNYDRNREIIQENSVPPTGTGTCMVGSCSGAVAARRGMCCCRKNASVSESATCGGRGSRQVTVDTAAGEREYLGGAGFTSTSLWSPENTSSGGGDYAKTSGDDLDHSVCHSRSQREAAGGDVGKRKLLGIEKSSVSTKRGRAAAVHNQSERKRRDKINQKMKTLQKLVPNCSKTDKASMLDEVIEYLKQLQAQVQMVNRMNMPSMMLPLALQQQLQMSMMGMGMGTHVMDINSIGRAATGLPPVIPPPAATGMPPATAFMPMPSSWDVPTDRLSSPMVMPNDILSAALMACQSQQQQQQPAMTMDAFSRLAALYQQFQQPTAPGNGSNN